MIIMIGNTDDHWYRVHAKLCDWSPITGLKNSDPLQDNKEYTDIINLGNGYSPRLYQAIPPDHKLW